MPIYYHNISVQRKKILQHNSTEERRDVISYTRQRVVLTKNHKKFAFDKYTEAR